MNLHSIFNSYPTDQRFIFIYPTTQYDFSSELREQINCAQILLSTFGTENLVVQNGSKNTC